jgi:hypothetical protein
LEGKPPSFVYNTTAADWKWFVIGIIILISY